MNRQNMPLILMLVAGAVTCVITLVQNSPLLNRMAALFFVLFITYFLGSILKWTLDHFDKQNEEKNKEEGEVIEKEVDGVVKEAGDKEEDSEE